MIFSAETRWFFSGRVPHEIDDWFLAGRRRVPHRGADEARVDHYLVSPGCDRVGVKLRNEVLLEIKTAIGNPQRLTLVPGIEGYLETFLKWSCPDRSVAGIESADPRPWVPVRKNRSLLTASLPAGCHAELTRIELTGALHWTFALEAIGPVEHAHALLLECGNRFFELRGTPPLALTLERSLSYAAWLAGSAARRPPPIHGGERGQGR
jgi:hypothetical protein